MKQIFIAVSVVLCIFVPTIHGQDIRFVNASSPFPGSGYMTWDTASHTIQEAINTANPGDFIYVADGTYIENVTVNKDIRIESWCREPVDCVIQAASPTQPAVTIADPTANSGVLIFHGFKLTGGSYGVYVSGNFSASTDYPIVSGCLFDGYTGTAFYAYQTVVILQYCTFVNNTTGAHFSGVNGNCWVRYNIFAYNSQYGLQVTGPYLQMGNNCYYSNLFHIFGSPTAVCDYWSANAMPDGVDPEFVDYVGGDYHLLPSSPCVDFDPTSFGYPECFESGLYDKDESRIDLGAYGGLGDPPNDPFWLTGSRVPSPGTYRVDQNADIGFGLEDWPAGIDLSSVQVTISNHGHPDEIFQIPALVENLCDYLGSPPSDCVGFCYEFNLSGTLHQQFEDYAYVRVSVSASDNCPTPNTFSSSWRFHADDVSPPQLDTFYPANGQTGVPLYGPLVFEFSDSPGVGVNHSSIELLINGASPPAGTRYYWFGDDDVTVIPGVRFTENTPYSIQVRVSDDYSNQMPWASFAFTTGTDGYPPFIPGVSTPPAAPNPPPDCQWPNPAPGDQTVTPRTGVSFTVQDYEHPVDVTTMVVQVSNGTDTWTYTYSGANTFTVSGTPYCAEIYCLAPTGLDGWGVDVDVTVDVSGARDTSPAAYLMTPVQWSFHTVLPVIPTTRPAGIMILLITMGVIIIILRK
ncbi:MAG TPA: Ig-like domain-containing protein [bacterium]|nr:Ig-like domain-containing protein [bacterium]